MNHKTKTLLALAISGLMASSAMAATAIPVSWGSQGGSGSFAGAQGANEFSFDLSGLSANSEVFITLSSTFGLGAGFDITGATFDGKAFSAALNFSSAQSPIGFDNWYFKASDLSQGLHRFTVTGLALGGGFNGAVNITSAPLAPVPEPSSYALLLAGMGVVALVVRRRGLQG